MADIGSILAVNLEARINQLERQMKRATDVSSQSFDKIERRSKQAATTLETNMARAGANVVRQLEKLNISNVGKNAFAGFAAGAIPAVAATLSVSAAISGAKAALDQFGDIADKSAAAGVSAEFFQSIAYQAGLSGVGIDQVAKALTSFTKNAGLAAIGQGDLYSKLKALNPELLRQLQTTSSQEERFKLVADAIDRAKTSSEKAAIASAAFGESGTRLVAVFDGGREAIERTADAAQRMGLIVSNDLIAQADELGDKFDTATQILDLQFKSVLIELAPLLIGTAEGIAGVIRMVEALGQAVANSPGMQNLVAQTAPLAQRSLDVMKAQLASREKALATAQADPSHAGWANTSIGADDAIKNLQTEAAQLRAAIAGRQDPSQFDVGATFATLAGQPKSTVLDKPAPVVAPRTGTGGTSAQDQQRRAVDNVTGALQRQLDALTQTDREQAIANELSRAHVDAASADGQKITELTGRLFDQRAALQANTTAANALAQTAEGAFEGMLDGSKSLGETLGDLAGALEKMVLQAALLGDGPLAGMFGMAPATSGAPGGIFGALFGSLLGLADGGEVRGPGSSTSDSIPAMLSDGEHVVKASEARKHRALLTAINSGRVGRFADGGAVGKLSTLPASSGAIGGQSVVINAPVTVNANGGTKEQNTDLAGQIGKQLEGRLRAVINDEIRVQSRPGNTLHNLGRR